MRAKPLLIGRLRICAGWILTVALTGVPALAVEAAPADGPAVAPAPDGKQAPVPATPASRGASWEQYHATLVARARKGGIELLFIGDSITMAWARAGKDIWQKNFEPLKAANFGISGDRTEHLLWRLQNGELEGITPKLAVLMIGTNNTSAKHAPEDIAAGVTAIVDTVKTKTPKTKILLLAIFPRGANARGAQRQNNDKVNAIIARLDDGGKTVKFLDIGAKFLAADGALRKEIMPDGLHLSAEGYEIETEAILPVIKEMMGEGGGAGQGGAQKPAAEPAPPVEK